MTTFRFVKEADSRWFVDLPQYLEQGIDKEELEMIAGSREMIELMAQGKNELYLQVNTTPFLSSDELVLCQQDGEGGGYYEMKTYQQIPVEHELWLCELIQVIFGTLPERLYIKNCQPSTP